MKIRIFLATTVAVCMAGMAPVNAATFTYSNTNAIIINDSAQPPTAASPYPSTNQVSRFSNSIIDKVTVRLFGFTHNFPDDVDIVLVGPGGQNTVLMANTGGESRMPVTNLDLTLDDDAASNLPLDTELVSGTFRPTERTNVFLFDFPAPAPTANELMGSSLANFKNTEPDGTWRLYVIDDSAGDSGAITGGWNLTITATPLLLSIRQEQTNAILSWTNAAVGYTLQTTPELSPWAWTNVLATPVIVSSYYTVTNPITTNRMYYRLAK